MWKKETIYRPFSPFEVVRVIKGFQFKMGYITVVLVPSYQSPTIMSPSGRPVLVILNLNFIAIDSPYSFEFDNS